MDNQPAEAILPGSDEIRGESSELYGNAANRVVVTMVIICKHALGLIGTALNHARAGGGSRQ